MNLEPLRELETVVAEMRARRVNHGKSESPTLLAWADRISRALAQLDDGWQIVGYMDPEADFMLPRKDGCVLSSNVTLLRDPSGRYTRPVYLPSPPAQEDAT